MTDEFIINLFLGFIFLFGFVYIIIAIELVFDIIDRIQKKIRK